MYDADALYETQEPETVSLILNPAAWETELECPECWRLEDFVDLMGHIKPSARE